MQTSNAPYNLLSPQDVSGKLSEFLLLDVRTPAEFEDAHIEGSVLHPLGDLNPEKVAGLASGKRGCLIICRSGGRARKAADALKAKGVTEVTVLDGGVSAWESSGLPLKKGKKTISLERQVRIVAGTLVVIGSALAYFVNPVWAAFSAFVGAGMVFAGVTDTCGMGMMLSKMPWNTKCGCESASRSTKR